MATVPACGLKAGRDDRCSNCHRRRTAQQLGYWCALPLEQDDGDASDAVEQAS